MLVNINLSIVIHGNLVYHEELMTMMKFKAEVLVYMADARAQLIFKFESCKQVVSF